LGVLEIFLFLVVALIVIPPDRLPEVMQAVGKVLRELRLASNTVVRELSGALEDPPYMQQHTHLPQRDEPSETSTDKPPSEPPAQT
jgi:Sec-independent protein translocase protein TatA